MDRYGYYQIEDLKTYSVYQLMDRHQYLRRFKNTTNSIQEIEYQWIYNDDFFSQYNWTQEPTESLKELYKQRALELRKEYDYIVLYYSGGYDSTNMLYAFLDNGIYPDEICRVDSSYDTVSHRYLEGKWKTWKKLDELEKRYPQIKIRRIDNGDFVCNWPNIIKNTNSYLNLDWPPIYYWGPRTSIHRLVLDHMYEYVDDWKQLLKNNKKLCTVHAVDGVQLRFNLATKELVHNYNDVDIYGHMTPIRQMTNKKDRDVLEFFYWAPTDTAVKIMMKQGHLAKKFFMNLSNGELEQLINMKDIANIDTKENYMLLRTFTYKEFKKLIYPRLFTDGEEFYEPKELNLWGNVDHWYYNNPKFPNSEKHWKEIYQSLFDKKHRHWKRFFYDHDIEKGHRKIRSKDYVIFKQ